MSSKNPPPRYSRYKFVVPLRARQFADFDYLDEIADNPELTEWLAKFCDEYYATSIRKNGNPLHNTDALRKSCYNADNANRRDIWNNYDRVPIDISEQLADSEDDE